MFLWKNINLIYMLDPIRYEFYFYLLLKLTRSREPEPKLRYSGSGFRLHNTADNAIISYPTDPNPQFCHWELWKIEDKIFFAALLQNILKKLRLSEPLFKKEN
jgi:hypothetical protein